MSSVDARSQIYKRLQGINVFRIYTNNIQVI